ncbi:MAG: chemotaxis protein CheW [Deltaproteobacteria bacterium]|nr:chemotaxis protein CheW [Deltaproteobacteria bacterium]
MIERVLLVRAGADRFGIPLSLSLGVVDAQVTPLPCTAQEQAGLLLHEGSLFPVFDPAPLLELHSPLLTGAIAVLLEVAGEPLALLCDGVEGTAPLDPQTGLTEGGLAPIDLPAAFPELSAGGGR